MSTRQARTRKVEKLVSQSARPESKASSVTTDVPESPLYGVAMLRMALELKRSSAATFEEVLRAVLDKMQLDEAPFRRYLEKNGGLLLALRRP